MTANRLRNGLLAAVVLLLAGLVTAQAQNRPQAAPTKVAVVDVDEVFREAKQAHAVNASNQRQLEEIAKTIQGMQDEIKQINADLEFMTDKSSKAYQDLLAKYERKALELRVWGELRQQEMLRHQVTNIELLYNKMNESVQRVAQANGIDLVLFQEPPVQFGGNKPDAVMGRISMRKVLWTNDSLDITAQVLQDMNTRFQQ